jgi:pimeloyl-ACP methyl ester carboxylesterase
MAPQTSPLIALATVALVAGIGGLLPVLPIEPVLIGIALSMPGWLAAPAIALATVSQMATKLVLLRGSARVARRLSEKKRALVRRVADRLATNRWTQRGTVLASAAIGMPPLYVTTVACGVLGVRIRDYLWAGAAGRALRFSALVLIPRLFVCAVMLAVPVVAHADTFVLLSGTVGGSAGFRRLELELTRAGHRVLAIDPYALSIDSADVSFAAMARRVDRILAAYHIEGARFVGHAHGAGVMLRVAAMSPQRVEAMYFLDVGAQATQRSPVLSGAIRLVPIITRMPRGRGFVRGRMIAGLRENSGRTEWLDSASAAAYTEPMLDDIGRVVRMALRLADASEPESLEAVLARVRAPGVVLLGETPRPAGPGTDEMIALERLGAQVRFERLPGIGHFPHEEAPAEVARLLTTPVVWMVASK